ncbi:ATP-dependent RNA helicase chl1, partial [Staphylotrichum tortipilum]
MTTPDNPPPEIDFHHPYQPYDVQLEFMRTVYDILNKGDGQVGILESPTGTGKSLSLLCATLTWLRAHKRARYTASFSSVASSMAGEPEWMVEAALRRRREEIGRLWEEREGILRKAREREREKEREGDGARERGGKRMRVVEKAGEGVDEEREFLVGEGGDDGDGEGGLSGETRKLMERVGMGSAGRKGEEEGGEAGEEEVKIYYTSRTHSQITQFISELRRPTFPPSLPSDLLSADTSQPPTEPVKQLPLSSRQKLCINPSVARLPTLAAINDRCADLQQSKSTSCPYLPSPSNLAQTHQFRDTALATIPDIEDLHRLGTSLKVCPYYASRTALPAAEVVTLPYPLLLQKNAREALGIKLEGNIVVIDEAHNIMDAVSNVHAAEIRLSELRRAREMLRVYVKRFGKKLKGENRVMVARVGKVVEALSECLGGLLEVKGEQGIVDSADVLKARGADQINLFDLINYIQASKLAYKIESYAAHRDQQEEPSSTSPPTKPTPVLHTLVSFLTALTNLGAEGRIFHEKLPATNAPDIKLSYLLLSPTHAFSSIASSARAVILAGGTMSPFEDYQTQLFPTLPPSKLITLSCGHVVPRTNLFVSTLPSSKPNGADPFEFSFQKRRDPAMIHSLGLGLLNMSTIVPDGIVVFFPSHGYLDEVVRAWQAPTPNTTSPTIWDRLSTKKSLFRETQGAPIEELLAHYSEAIFAPASKGALLLSVIGGKLSEGINFSDRLGRCVIVVGLPYPNIHAPDWKARLEYLEQATLTRLQGEGISPAEAKEKARQAAREFYENACMRAVNQSIGRAIRHRGDYAAVVLVDRRFGGERVRGKLPGWIGGGL